MPAPIAAPRRRPPRTRLDTINDPAVLGAPAGPAPSKPVQRQVRCCENPDLRSGQHCENCGAVFEDSNIVSEVQFGENSAGAAIVEGGLVANDQRFANTMGGTVRGIGGTESRKKTEYRATDEIRKLVGALHLRGNLSEMAERLYRLALNHGFVQGRRVRNVAACAIYAAARRQPDCMLLLMDLAVTIRVNVWALGKTYKEFLEVLMIEDGPQERINKNPDISAVPQLESLMLKFCRKLEFGSDSHRVAGDACMLLRRMNRDWMIQGRQPAGICGACIILAARMNNYRRTIREVVYVVKVADSTINQRLYEFKRTKSSLLTVDQFRRFGVNLKDDMQPPSVYKRAEKEERKRKRAARELEGDEDIDDAVSVAVSDTTVKNPVRTQKKRKVGKGVAQVSDTKPQHQLNASNNDEDNGFLIPQVRLDPKATAEDAMDFENQDHLEYVAAAAAPEERLSDEEAAVPIRKKSGRPKKKAPVVIPDEDLEIEADIEDELLLGLKELEASNKIFEEIVNDPNHETLVTAEGTGLAQACERTTIRFTSLAPKKKDDDGVEVVIEDPLSDNDFEDDDDVRDCLNTPEEIALKEKIWVTENEDWLRDQQKKMLAKELENAKGKPEEPKRKRKRTQMGDLSVLDGKPAASPREAVGALMKKNARMYSSHIDYEKFLEIFPDAQTPEAETPSGSGEGASPAASGTSKRQEAKVVEEVQDIREEEFEEEEEEIEDQYEEEDLENQYADDDDMGFGADHYEEDY